MADGNGSDAKRVALFRLIIDELKLSVEHKAMALSHVADLHALLLRTINGDDRFIAQLSQVLDDEQTKPDALDTGIPEIVKQFAPKHRETEP